VAAENDMVDLDGLTDHPYQRLAIHISYGMAPGADYDASSRLIANQGLCRVAGDRVPGCAGTPLDYLLDHLCKCHTWRLVVAAASLQVVHVETRGWWWASDAWSLGTLGAHVFFAYCEFVIAAVLLCTLQRTSNPGRARRPHANDAGWR
jgi:hypothetical protein